MEDDTIRPIFGINKELNVQFVLGYTPDEFARTLRPLAEGEVDVAPMVTGKTASRACPRRSDARLSRGAREDPGRAGAGVGLRRLTLFPPLHFIQPHGVVEALHLVFTTI